jgi:hypothetical protein
MLRVQLQFMIFIYFRLFLEWDLVYLYVKQGCNMIQIFEPLCLVCQNRDVT